MSSVPMRVMIDTGNAPANGGIGVYSNGLIRSLRAFAGDAVQINECPASFGATRWRALRRANYLWRLRKLVRNGFIGSEIVHFTVIYVPPPTDTRIPYILTLHDADPANYPEFFPPQFRQYARLAFAIGARRADMVLTDSQASRDALRERYRFEESRIHTIAIGIYPDLIEAARRSTPPVPGKVPTLLYVGAIYKKKNIAWLVRERSAGVRSGALPRLRLVLAGNPSFGFGEILRELKMAGGIAVHVNNPNVEELVSLYQCSSAGLTLRRPRH